jgi:hypothetical protein
MNQSTLIWRSAEMLYSITGSTGVLVMLPLKATSVDIEDIVVFRAPLRAGNTYLDTCERICAKSQRFSSRHRIRLVNL